MAAELDDLLLAFDRGEHIGAKFVSLREAGLVTTQGDVTPEGEKALLALYKLRVTALESEAASLKQVGDLMRRALVRRLSGHDPVRRQLDPELAEVERLSERWKALAPAAGRRKA